MNRFFFTSIFSGLLSFALAQPVQVKYTVTFNQGFDRGANDVRTFDGILNADDSTSEFYMLPKPPSNSGREDLDIHEDTVWRTRVRLEDWSLCFQDRFNVQMKSKWYVDSLFPYQWIIDTTSKMIGSVMCRRATTHFRGRGYVAWFNPSMPLPFGPWKMGGLPGLIWALTDVNGDLNVEFTSIKTSQSWLLTIIDPLPFQEFVSNTRLVRRMLKASAQPRDCLECETNVTFNSWERWNF